MKKTVNLKLPEVTELSREEMKQIDGGLFGFDDFLVGVAIGAAIAIINDWDNFERGITGQPYKRN